MRRSVMMALSLVIASAIAIAGCDADERRVELIVGEHPFFVELARTEEEWQRGLMFRETLGADEGMLFVFPDSRPRSFWMRDTRIPLSIAYIDADGRILEIHDMEPFSLEPVRSRSPARYALEVNRGRFDELGIVPGDRIDVSSFR